jgi:hypothetical protein
MSTEIYLMFRARAAPGTTGSEASEFERSAARLLGVAGVVAARPFSVSVVLGDRAPAFYPELVICEIDVAVFDRAAAAPLGIAGGTDAVDPDGGRFVAWEAASIGVRGDFDLPAHLYLQFSAHPPSMSFDEYSDWYQVHQDENIAQSAVLRRGWRFRLGFRVPAVAPGPTHLALYELEGTLETLTGDLGRAMETGVISLPDWFTRFASLEGVAVAERLTA